MSERLVRLAMLAYPRSVRDAQGEEILDTLHDVSGESQGLQLHESIALIRAGLQARTSVASAHGNRRPACEICAQAVPVIGLVILIEWFHFDRLVHNSSGGFGGVEHKGAFFTQQVLLVLAVAAALVGYERLSALFGLVWIGVFLNAAFGKPSFAVGNSTVEAVRSFAIVLVPLVCYLVVLLAPRARRGNPRRLLWLGGAAVIGLLSPLDLNPGYGLGLTGAITLLLLIAGLAALPAGPKIPLTVALVLFSLGLPHWTFRMTAISVGHFDEVSPGWVIATVLGPIVLAGGAVSRLASVRRTVAG